MVSSAVHSLCRVCFSQQTKSTECKSSIGHLVNVDPRWDLVHFLHRKIALKKFSPASQQRTWKDQTYPRKQLGQPRLGTFFSRFQPCFRLRCTSMSLISRSRNTTRLKWTAYIHVMSKEPLIFTIWLHGGCRTKRSGSVNFTLHLQHGQATAKYVCWEKVSRALAGAWFLPWDIESPKPKKVARSARSARSRFLYQIHPKTSRRSEMLWHEDGTRFRESSSLANFTPTNERLETVCRMKPSGKEIIEKEMNMICLYNIV